MGIKRLCCACHVVHCLLRFGGGSAFGGLWSLFHLVLEQMDLSIKEPRVNAFHDNHFSNLCSEVKPTRSYDGSSSDLDLNSDGSRHAFLCQDETLLRGIL